MTTHRTVGDIIADLPPVPGIGDNNPPAPTAFEAVRMDILDLLDLSRTTLTGKPLANEAQAAAVQSLVAQARTAKATADTAREADKAPHLAAGRAVDKQYKPLIADAERIRDAGLAALGPWLEAVQAKQRAEAAEAKRKADEAAAAALALSRATNAADIEAVEAREAALKHAAQAASEAAKADKARAVASSGTGRGVGLRIEYIPEVTSPAAFWAWLRENRKAECLVWMAEMAARETAAGNRSMDGVTITERSIAR